MRGRERGKEVDENEPRRWSIRISSSPRMGVETKVPEMRKEGVSVVLMVRGS